MATTAPTPFDVRLMNFTATLVFGTGAGTAASTSVTTGKIFENSRRREYAQ